MKENGRKNSTKNGYHKYSSVFVSKDPSDSAEKIYFYVEEKNDVYVRHYVISAKQAENLSLAGIELESSGCHHFVPQTLSSKVKLCIRNDRDKTKINKLKALADEMDFDLVIAMPNYMHQNHNKVFAGDFTPEEVLKKLDWILDDTREFTNGYKTDLLDMFSIVSVFGGKNVECGLDFGKIAEMKNDEKEIIPNDLLELFGIKKENILKYLETFFFYPKYQYYMKHFELLSELRTSDRVRKTRLEIFMNYMPAQAQIFAEE